MGPDGIVVSAPGLNDRAGVGEDSEQMLSEAFVPKPALETLDEPVLLRPARCDVVPQHRPFFLPVQERVRGHLGAVAHYR